MSIETQSKISLISNALVLAGEPVCSSLSEDRYGVTVLAQMFELIYENELQSAPWRFSMKKRALSRLNVEPLNEFRYAYQLPSDCLLVRGMTFPQQYELYGEHLYTNATAVELEYQFKPDINKCPAYFSLLLSYSLAKDAVKPITEGEEYAKYMEAKYQMQRGKALYADAQARPARSVIDSPFTDARG